MTPGRAGEVDARDVSPGRPQSASQQENVASPHAAVFCGEAAPTGATVQGK